MQKFLCDEMCANLGKWLRIAGYDTLVISISLKDSQIYEMAKKEDRKVISKDHHFKEMDPALERVIFLSGEDLDEWALQLKKEEGIDWLYAPFSRCLICNTRLEKSKESRFISLVPQDIEEFWICPRCHQAFWFGSHTQKMRNQLEKWQHAPN